MQRMPRHLMLMLSAPDVAPQGLGALRGLRTEDFVGPRKMFGFQKQMGEVWHNLRACLEGAAKTCSWWGWPRPSAPVWDGLLLMNCSTAKVLEQWGTLGAFPVTATGGVPEGWSLSALRSNFGELEVWVDVATSSSRLSRPGRRVHVWQICDYARGLPPPCHPQLGSLNPAKTWHVRRWQPWKHPAAGRQLPQPWAPREGLFDGNASDQFGCLWSSTSGGTARANAALKIDAAMTLAPPGTSIGLHQPFASAGVHVLLWQLEGEQEIAACPACACSSDGALPNLWGGDRVPDQAGAFV